MKGNINALKCFTLKNYKQKIHVFFGNNYDAYALIKNSIPMEIYNELNQKIYDTNLVLNKWKTDFKNLYADNTKETKYLSDIIKNINYHIALIENNMMIPYMRAIKN